MQTLLITGAGGPAAISFMKAIRHLPIAVHAADMDPHAAGLYLVAAAQRALLPPGNADDFVDALLAHCLKRGVTVLVPTVDCELLRVAAARQLFEARGIAVLLAPTATLATCLDKWELAQRCRDRVLTPKTVLYAGPDDALGMTFPLVLKPRRGSGSRGVQILQSAAALPVLHKKDHHRYLLQEHLPGEEYSVDVLADLDGRVCAAVPRNRLKVDSGVAVTCKTVFDPELVDVAVAVAQAVGVTLVANVQLKRNAHGRPALLEVNPRFPGSMPLTVEAGVNMPALALDVLAGARLPHGLLPYREVAMVRYLEERFIDVSELDIEQMPVHGATNVAA